MNESSTTIRPGAQPFFLSGGPLGILIIHGYGGSIDEYRTFGQHLHDAGYTVSGIRLAGHGITPAVLAQNHMRDWRESIDQGLAQLHQTCPSVVVLGASFGGVLAADAASRHDNIRGLILVNTPFRYRKGGRWQTLALTLLRLLTPYYQKPGLSSADRDRYQQTGSMTKWPISGIMETGKFLNQNFSVLLDQLHIPVAVFAVENDAVTGDSPMQDILQHLNHVPHESHLLPGASHRPFRDPDIASQLEKEIKNFISVHIAAPTKT